jgi:hypothetical protein
MNILVHPSQYGPNNIQYYLLEEDTIQTVSTFELNIFDMQVVEGKLNLVSTLGIRFAPMVERDEFGQYITTWAVLTYRDVDRS